MVQKRFAYLRGEWENRVACQMKAGSPGGGEECLFFRRRACMGGKTVVFLTGCGGAQGVCRSTIPYA